MLRVIENRIIKETERVTEIWGKLHNDDFHNIYRSSNTITAFK
jgi:hypothetical protein